MKRQQTIQNNDEDRIRPWIIEVSDEDISVPIYYACGGDIIITSKISGKTYRFNEGKPTIVNKADADYFLTLTKISGCCGSSITVNLFGIQ